MSEPYKIPTQTRIGHVHLKVSDLNRSLEFYRDLLGFEVTMFYGTLRYCNEGKAYFIEFQMSSFFANILDNSTIFTQQHKR